MKLHNIHNYYLLKTQANKQCNILLQLVKNNSN